MSDISAGDKPGFVAEEPEHCFACYQLIRPGGIDPLTMKDVVILQGHSAWPPYVDRGAAAPVLEAP
jgi:hypothetical protein